MGPDEERDPLEDIKKLDRFLSGQEQTTLYFELEKRNWAPSLDDNLTDEEVSQQLTSLLWSLKDLGVYVEHADHVSDRDLYEMLLPFCDRPAVVFPNNPYAGFHWSPIGSGSEEDQQIYLRYYADDDDRAQHMIDYPEIPLPAKSPLPYPRPWIPVREWPTFDDEEPDF